MTSPNNNTSSYPKPPYDNCEEVWHTFDTPMDSQCAYRAMERDGRIFKNITEKVNGLKYIYWHPEKNGVELWHTKNNVCAWASGVQYLEERFVFACLRSGGSAKWSDEGPASSADHDIRAVSASEDSDYDIVDNSEEEKSAEGTVMDIEDSSAQQTPPHIEWAHSRLNGFKAGAKFKMLFHIPDFTGFAPSWQLTPALLEAMDGVLSTYQLPKAQTILYDKSSCGLIWLRRDCSSYEIRTNNHYALEYAQQFILHQLYMILTTWHLAPHTIPTNSALWVSVYDNVRHERAMRRQRHWQSRKNNINNNHKPRQKQKHYQQRKNKKRQMMTRIEE